MKKIVCAFIAAALSTSAVAQTRIKLSLDWLFEGQTSFLQMAVYKKYFADEGLDVQVDVGKGSAGAFQRIVSGAYDAALGDMSAQIEFLSRNPGPPSFQSVYVQYEQIPAAFFTLKRTGIHAVREFPGKRLLGPQSGFTRRIWPLVAKYAGIDPNSVHWVTAAPALRGTMLINNDADIIAGFYNVPLELTPRGIKESDIISFPVADYGIHYYGNTLLASAKLIKENPKAVQGLVRAFNRAFIEALADPATSVKYLKQREPLIDEKIELQRFKLVIPGILTENVRKNGLGGIDRKRLEAQIDQVMIAYGLTNRPTVDELFNPAFLPPLAQRMPK